MIFPSRYEKKPMERVVDHIPGLEDRLQLCFQKNSALEDTMGKFAGTGYRTSQLLIKEVK